MNHLILMGSDDARSYRFMRARIALCEAPITPTTTASLLLLDKRWALSMLGFRTTSRSRGWAFVIGGIACVVGWLPVQRRILDVTISFVLLALLVLMSTVHFSVYIAFN